MAPPLPLRRTAGLVVCALLLVGCPSDDSPTDTGGEDGGADLTVAQVSVSPTSGSLEVGETLQFTATVTNQAGRALSSSVSWSTSASDVATVSSGGLVTGVGAGTATLTASAGGKSGTASITVTDPTPPSAPSNLVAAASSHTTVGLTWSDDSDNESGFSIEREPGATGTRASAAARASAFTEVATVGAGVTTFEDTGLDPGTAYRYRVRAVNDHGASDYTGSVDVTTHEVLTMTTTSLPEGTQNVEYSVTLEAAGGSGSFTWSLTSGTLPAGLSLSEGGVISGTPTAAESVSIELTVTSGGQSVARTFTITIDEEILDPRVLTEELPDGAKNQSYSASLEADRGDGSYTWSLDSGALPDGLELASDGTVSGTPTAVGTFAFTVKVESAGLSGTGEVTLTIHSELAMTTPALDDGLVGTAYSATLTATGGDGTYRWEAVSGLPPGLTLDTGGTLSGTPTSAGSYTLTVKVESGDGQEVTADLDIVIVAVLEITTTALDNGTVGTPYSVVLHADGGLGDKAWSVSTGDLPDGLSLGASTGTVSGTPTVAGTFTFTVQATSGGESDTAGLSITIDSGPQPGYQIELKYLTSIGTDARNAVESAKSRWESIVTGDVADFSRDLSECSDRHPETLGGVDDIVIYVKVESIDGESGTVGRGGPCYLRGGSDIPLTGVLIIDSDDVSSLSSRGLLDDVTLHEMGHVLGIGTLWDRMGLLTGDCLVDPAFTGAGARAAFDAAGGDSYVDGKKVPVEDTGSLDDGSNCAHWRESVLDTELMTSSLDRGSNPLSAITIQSLGDQGYAVTTGPADSYTLPSPSPVAAEEGASPAVILGRDVLQPLYVVYPNGQVRVIRPSGR